MNLIGFEADLRLWCGLWLVIALFVIIRHWRYGQGVGILLAYVISLASIHWIGAVIYILPWYVQSGGDLVAAGMRESTFAIAAMAVGAELVSMNFKSRLAKHQVAEVQPVDPAVVTLYLITGVVLYAVLIPVAARIATIGALVSTGSTVAVVGLSLKCWNAWYSGMPRRLARWLLVAAFLPFVTVATQGYLGYGMAAMSSVFVFVASFYGPRWKTVLAGFLLAFLGLSVYVTYMRDRGELRTVIREGGTTFSDRADRVLGTLSNFEWFDPREPAHLYRIDDRLNQNYLVGAAIRQLEKGAVPFAHGSTITDAAMAIVPRALWSEKNVAAGSGDLVGRFTGMTFAEGTSVGIGQIMECYVNFGRAGVIVGFVIIGALLKLLDLSSVWAVSRGDVRRFTLIYLPGLGLLQVGGSLVDITTVAAAGFGVALLLNYLTKNFVGLNRAPQRPHSLEPASSGDVE